jgi:hypothetical protein
MKRISFSKSLSFEDLQEIVDIEEKIDFNLFKDWFNFEYNIPNNTKIFLSNLIKKNRLYFDDYLEEELKAKFLIPILNHVDFITNNCRDWYERTIKAEFNNNVILTGSIDFMVAKGRSKPVAPYFFIQEFKKSLAKSNPKYQLIAQMLVALNLNQSKIIKGAFVIGKSWNFVILQKTNNNKYIYFVSEDFDSSKVTDLESIYKNLLFIKHEIISL